MSVNIKTPSALIWWQTPLYTGGNGVSIENYEVAVNGQTTTVINDDSGTIITHTITAIQYNTDYSVQVTAINTCGQESEPATVIISIKARG